MDIAGYMKSSSMVFFTPNDHFFNTIMAVPWRWRNVFDMGAGMGTLTAALRARGRSVVACDLYKRDDAEVNDIIEVDSLSMLRDGTKPSDLVIVARPCHNTGFARTTLLSAASRGCIALYIGLPNNIDEDLGEDIHYEILAENVGEEGEIMLRIHGKKRDMECWSLIQIDAWNKPGWMTHRDGKWVNAVGGGFPHRGETVVEEKFVADYWNIFMDKAQECDDESIIGWLAPNGEWFGCTSSDHDHIMEHVIGLSVEYGEEQNFIRCYGKVHGSLLQCFGGRNPETKRATPQQAKVLRSKGYGRETVTQHSSTTY